MNEILKQYRRIYRTTVIGNWTVSVVCVVLLAVVGGFSRSTFQAIVVSSALVLLSLFYTAEFIIEPPIFRRKIAKAGGEVQAAIEEKPMRSRTCFFFGKTDVKIAVFFANFRIKYVNCGDIVGAELKRFKIRLTMKDGRTLGMPFGADENPAVLCAALSSLNEGIDFVINGKHVALDSKNRKKTDQSEDKL